jgi:hypothetical protein
MTLVEVLRLGALPNNPPGGNGALNPEVDFHMEQRPFILAERVPKHLGVSYMIVPEACEASQKFDPRTLSWHLSPTIDCHGLQAKALSVLDVCKRSYLGMGSPHYL